MWLFGSIIKPNRVAIRLIPTHLPFFSLFYPPFFFSNPVTYFAFLCLRLVLVYHGVLSAFMIAVVY